MNLINSSLFIIINLFLINLTKSELSNNNNNNNNKDNNIVPVNKCCEINELYVEKYCTPINQTKETKWQPTFTNERGKIVKNVHFIFVTGSPDCGSKQAWPIYHYKNSTDRLQLLPNGVLRHYFDHRVPGNNNNDGESLEIEITNGKNLIYYDYEPGKYCMDKKIAGSLISEFARVCAPDQEKDWTTTEFLMRNIINPITHGIGLICLVIIAIIYFIMPTLRDLVGNIVTTISMCLIVSQAADLIRLLTVFNSHISLIITETVCYVSLLGAFFWLNTLGYYIWKTFKSRNVFLRITDGKKYCYYSGYAWSCTLILGFLAVFAHFTMDYPQTKPSLKFEQEQEEIGSLGIIIFFVPVAFIVLMNIFFFTTTLRIINRMHTYGRIHHKLRHSFRMFLLLLLIMTITWLFFLMSFFKFDGLINCYIIVNAFQAPLILYVCIFNQKHVAYLLRKACCHQQCVCATCQPEIECEWGDEMTAMNTGIY